MRRSACVPLPTPGAPTSIIRAARWNFLVGMAAGRRLGLVEEERNEKLEASGVAGYHRCIEESCQKQCRGTG